MGSLLPIIDLGKLEMSITNNSVCNWAIQPGQFMVIL